MLVWATRRSSPSFASQISRREKIPAEFVGSLATLWDNTANVSGSVKNGRLNFSGEICNVVSYACAENAYPPRPVVFASTESIRLGRDNSAAGPLSVGLYWFDE